jgi:hypothetical protein
MKKLYFLLLCVAVASTAVAQQKQSKKKKSPSTYNKANKENEKFLEKQWWLGIKGGVNLCKAKVEASYSVPTAINYELSPKKYEGFKRLGSQVGLEISFFFKGFSLGLQPTYRHSQFAYSNTYSWVDTEVPTSSVTLNYEQEQKVEHFLLPLVLKYEITGDKLRPYVQLGGFSAILINATKSVTVSGVDLASGGPNAFENDPIIIGASGLFAKSYSGMIAGGGVNYNLGNVRLNFDVQYYFGMTNVTSAKNRYSNDRLSGVGDTFDDLTLDNIAVSVGCLFPLRFLEDGFKSMSRKK